MDISVVIATYNGAAYIVDQLESILAQSEPVNEVVITDDGSIDGTLEICRGFIIKNNLSNWRVIKNEGMHGFYGNFCHGLRNTTGDLILLCDQDDIWLPYKVKMMIDCFAAHSDMLSLASTFSRFNKDIVLCAKQNHPNSLLNGLKKISHKEFLDFYNYLGMSMMIHRELLDLFLHNCVDISGDFKSHDILLNYLAAQNNGLYYLDKVLTRRRSYNESTSNINMHADFENSKYRNFHANKYRNKVEYILLFQTIAIMRGISAERINCLSEYAKNYEKRVAYLETGNVIRWILNIKNLQYYAGFSDYLKDFMRLHA